jgi:hypothetical protein
VGRDPADIVAEGGAEALDRIIDAAVDDWTLFLVRLDEADTASDRAALVDRGCELVAITHSETEREMMLRDLHAASGVPARTLRAQVARAGAKTPGAASAAAADCGVPGSEGHGTGKPKLKNYTTEPRATMDGSHQQVQLARAQEEIVDQVIADHGPDIGRIAGELFHARETPDEGGERIHYVGGTDDLMRWLHDRYEVYWSPRRNDADGRSMVTPATLAAALTYRARAYQGVTAYPLHPEPESMFVRWTEPADYDAEDGWIDEFLSMFSPATPRDRTLLEAMLLTLYWGGGPGRRPLFIVAPTEEGAAQQAIGKSTLARSLARLVGGAMELKLQKQTGFADDLAKQALAPVNLSRRVAIIDNVTGTLRDDALTDLVTTDTIHGRAAYGTDAKRANVITWVCTTNEATFSADIASRACIIRLRQHDGGSGWIERLDAFLAEHCHHVAADALRRLRRGRALPEGSRHSRFQSWDDHVLAQVDDGPGALEHMIREARASDSDAEEVGAFLAELADQHPAVMGFPKDLKIGELCRVWTEALGRELSSSLLGRVLQSARVRGACPGLAKIKTGGRHVWRWSPWEWEASGRGRDGEPGEGSDLETGETSGTSAAH